jgi:hypothetical protein
MTRRFLLHSAIASAIFGLTYRWIGPRPHGFSDYHYLNATDFAARLTHPGCVECALLASRHHFAVAADRAWADEAPPNTEPSSSI